MKKYFVFVLTALLMIAMSGCSNKTYQLAWDGFCYKVQENGYHTEFELQPSDKKYIIDLLNEASWEEVIPECSNDFIFSTQKQHIRYHSECGTFYDVTNQRSVTLPEEEHRKVNSILIINEIPKKEE